MQELPSDPTPLGMVGMLGECTSIRIALVSLSSNQSPQINTNFSGVTPALLHIVWMEFGVVLGSSQLAHF